MSKNISFCTVAMNRVDHIKRTLPENLKDNNFPGIEFILLDYNSNDGLDRYIKENFVDEIASGKLVYYRYNTDKCFDRSHSRNMAFRLASGSIVCNIDADNYAGAGFSEFVYNNLNPNDRTCLTGLQNKWCGDASGKLCITKKEFMDVSGYDESFEGYGFEDYDLVNRLMLNGCNSYTINNKNFLKAITHSNVERLENESIGKSVQMIFVSFIDENSSVILYLFKDYSFRLGKVINTYTLESDKPSLEIVEAGPINNQYRLDNGWMEGHWRKSETSIFLNAIGMQMKLINDGINATRMKNEVGHIFHSVTNNQMKLDSISFLSQTRNRDKVYYNLENNVVRPNNQFGSGYVVRNFNHQPIHTYTNAI